MVNPIGIRTPLKTKITDHPLDEITVAEWYSPPSLKRLFRNKLDVDRGAQHQLLQLHFKVSGSNVSSPNGLMFVFQMVHTCTTIGQQTTKCLTTNEALE